jgi:hypothetical protein
VRKDNKGLWWRKGSCQRKCITIAGRDADCSAKPAVFGIFNRSRKILSLCTPQFPGRTGIKNGVMYLAIRGMDMRFTHISLIAVMLVVIAVAGCSGSSPTNPSGGGTQATSSSSSGSSGSSAAAVGGTDLFGGLNYNWVEYKMSTGSGDQAMTIYYKYDKQTGKCSMRFEGAAAANMPASMQNIDCSSKSGSTPSDPNHVSSDAQVSCSPLDESVTVPAGTFSATKCTVTSASQGTTATMWVVKNKFMVKMDAGSTQGGSVSMVLNSYG